MQIKQLRIALAFLIGIGSIGTYTVDAQTNGNDTNNTNQKVVTQQKDTGSTAHQKSESGPNDGKFGASGSRQHFPNNGSYGQGPNHSNSTQNGGANPNISNQTNHIVGVQTGLGQLNNRNDFNGQAPNSLSNQPQIHEPGFNGPDRPSPNKAGSNLSYGIQFRSEFSCPGAHYYGPRYDGPRFCRPINIGLTFYQGNYQIIDYQDYNNAQSIIHRTAIILLDAQNCAVRYGYNFGLARAVAYQQRALELYWNGYYNDAIYYSIRARDIAFQVIINNHQEVDSTYEWNQLEDGYIHSAPPANDLDVWFNGKIVGSDNEALHMHFELDLNN